ncbi:hypothetical protein NLG42_21360 [Flavobacterium plurextorum]|uniref:hypothetical protein n=1 Tax=Flavobacterium TaxID=237 RepID=UPI00214DAC93|nr:MULTISPECIES: hypothetical protein [Flavobacterium]UUW08639.1 hypothetical protein NLG42_21360 [Flavobacterium plurextorum]
MINIYPLEWFDSLLINTLDVQNSTVDFITPNETELISERLASESSKIKDHIRKSFFELKNKRQTRLLIRKYHSSLVFLLDSITAIKNKKNGRAPEFLKVLDLIISSLDDLLSFVEIRYSAFISLDQRVPSNYIRVWKAEMNTGLNKLIKKKVAADNHNLDLEFIVKLLLAPLQNSRNLKYTYRQVLYYREMLGELENLDYAATDSPCFSNLDLLLIRMNFNSRQYAERLAVKLDNFLNTFEVLSERLENIFLCCRKLTNINSDLKLTFNPSQQHLITFLEYWFSTEIKYIEKKTAVLLQEQNGLLGENELFHKKEDNRLECILSGDQIGLILRASDEARIIKAKSMNYIFKSIVPYLSTPVKKNLSYQSVRSKSYNAEERDKEIAIASLQKIISKIKTY